MCYFVVVEWIGLGCRWCIGVGNCDDEFVFGSGVYGYFYGCVVVYECCGNVVYLKVGNVYGWKEFK